MCRPSRFYYIFPCLKYHFEKIAKEFYSSRIKYIEISIVVEVKFDYARLMMLKCKRNCARTEEWISRTTYDNLSTPFAFYIRLSEDIRCSLVNWRDSTSDSIV